MSDISPLVSILLCTYNGEKFLKDQLGSLLKQTYSPVEIIIVDDCSTDGTYGLLEGYQRQHTQIRLYQNEKNLGYAKNFAYGIGLCKGVYIALCDQDDIWDEDKIKLLVAHINSHTLIYHDSRFMDEEGEIFNKQLSDVVNFYKGDKPEAFVFFNCISSHAVMFKKEIVRYLVPFPKAGFHDAWIGYVACNLGTITFLNKNLVLYRQHKSSVTDILKLNGKMKKLSKSAGFLNNLNFIKACAALPVNKRPEVVSELYRLYQRRTQMIFNFPLMLLFFKHFRTFLFIYKKSFLSKINFIIKHSKKADIH